MFNFFKSFFRKQETVSPENNEINIEKSNKPLNESLNTKVEQPFKRPSKKQLEESDLLGIVVNPNMSSREVWQLVEAAKKDPKTKKIYEEYIARQNAIFEAEDKEEYGDAIVDEQKKWEKLCLVGVHHIVIFKKGKTLDADIIEFERASIEGDTKFYVKIEGLRPKIYKPRSESAYIEWEKEISFRPNQILEVVTLPAPIDMFAINDYELVKERANQLKEKHT
jgi:hypothetical protein